jgi:hypothetical protein
MISHMFTFVPYGVALHNLPTARNASSFAYLSFKFHRTSIIICIPLGSTTTQVAQNNIAIDVATSLPGTACEILLQELENRKPKANNLGRW